MPQPHLVPVRPIFSRIAQSSGVSGSTSTSNALPLIVRFAIAFPLLGLVPALESDAGPKTAPVQIQILHIWRGIIDVRRGTSRFPGEGAPRRFRRLATSHLAPPPPSCPANAGHPVRRGLSALSPASLGYWIALM